MEEQKELPPVKNATREDVCAFKARQEGSPKCRGHYLSNGYVTQWRGMDASWSHPPSFEVLVRGDDAVACFGAVMTTIEAAFDQWSPCITLQRTN
jgi:hypothetical protein